MRTPKFRTILKNEKTYREAEWINFFENKVLVSISWFSEWHEYKILEQSTWAIDKNWREIFEWDILECTNIGSNSGMRVVVKYNLDNYLSYKWVSWIVLWYSLHVWTTYEIVWNINENADFIPNNF